MADGERGLKRMLFECARGTCTADLTDTFVTEDGIRVRQWECSECGHTFEDVYGEYEFCPRCGRRILREGQDEEDQVSIDVVVHMVAGAVVGTVLAVLLAEVMSRW